MDYILPILLLIGFIILIHDGYMIMKDKCGWDDCEE